jgi:hypothetical protein
MPDLMVTSQYAYTDAYSPLFGLYIELKCRRTHYDELLIERAKWMHLRRLPNARYINSTPLGIYAFNIQSLDEPKWMMRVMPKQTDFEQKEKVWKEIGYLPIILGIDITNLLI